MTHIPVSTPLWQAFMMLSNLSAHNTNAHPTWPFVNISLNIKIVSALSIKTGLKRVLCIQESFLSDNIKMMKFPLSTCQTHIYAPAALLVFSPNSGFKSVTKLLSHDSLNQWNTREAVCKHGWHYCHWSWSLSAFDTIHLMLHASVISTTNQLCLCCDCSFCRCTTNTCPCCLTAILPRGNVMEHNKSFIMKSKKKFDVSEILPCWFDKQLYNI